MISRQKAVLSIYAACFFWLFAATRGTADGPPVLDVSPTLLSQTIKSGETPVTNTIVVRNLGGETMNYVVAKDAGWIVLDKDDGTIEPGESDEVLVSYQPLTAGASVTIYTGRITFTAAGALGSPREVPVEITVRPQPELRVSRTALQNSTMQGYDASTQLFDVWNGTGLDIMDFNISKDVPWLMTSITSGSSTGEHHTVRVSYSSTGLDVGRSNATITVNAWDRETGLPARSSPTNIAVTLDIKPIAILSQNAGSITHEIRKGGSPPDETFAIQNICAWPQGVLGYELSTDADWLRVAPEDGTLAAETTAQITISYDSSSLQPGTHRANIVVSGTDVGTGLDAINSPQRIDVELIVEPAISLDFSGDGVAELVVYNQLTGWWHILNIDGRNWWSERFGRADYVSAPGDYHGRGSSALGVYRPASGSWYAKHLNEYSILVVGEFGGPEFQTVRGDFDGDGRQDFALYSEDTGKWFIASPDGNVILWDFLWGGPGLVPLAADFSGNGADDLAVYHQETGAWFIITAQGMLLEWNLLWGGPGFVPLAADFNGDGLADLAAYHESGWWFIASLTKGVIVWGMNLGDYGFTALAGDYDGSGAADLAVYRDGFWYISTITGDIIVDGWEWGGYGCIPIGM